MQADTKKQITDAIETHKKMVGQLEVTGAQKLIDAAEMIIQSIKQGGTVYVCGNGGSAADAQHIAGELVGRFRRERSALPAMALSTDTSVITAVANDYGYNRIFSRQVEALVKSNDLLWAISTSGSSANVVAAAESAKQKGAKILAFTGRADCELEKLADIYFCVDAQTIARSQEIHQLAYHIICDLVEADFCESQPES